MAESKFSDLHIVVYLRRPTEEKDKLRVEVRKFLRDNPVQSSRLLDGNVKYIPCCIRDQLLHLYWDGKNAIEVCARKKCKRRKREKALQAPQQFFNNDPNLYMASLASQARSSSVSPVDPMSIE